ncbi:MAG TPA: hypothetical protein VKE73_04290, partial [Myxococcota bacterium]|nr:hypothetical protein [Myxococcota bacterium]
MLHTSILVMTGIALALAVLVQRQEFFALRGRPTRDTLAALAVGLLVVALSTFALAIRQRPLAYAFTLWIL